MSQTFNSTAVYLNSSTLLSIALFSIPCRPPWQCPAALRSPVFTSHPVYGVAVAVRAPLPVRTEKTLQISQSTGDIYSGSWVANKKTGKGMYQFGADDSTMHGTWVDGTITEGTWTFKVCCAVLYCTAL